MLTMKQFAKKHGVRLFYKRVDANPHFHSDGKTAVERAREAQWHLEASHWKCLLRCGDKKLGLYYSMGSAHTKPPTVQEILSCLASDAAGIENSRSYEEWCGDLGYDSDSRKALRTYRICERQSEKLQALLGDAAYDELLYKTEQL